MEPEVNDGLQELINYQDGQAKKGLLLIGLYITAAIFLLATAWVIYKKRKSRGVLQAINNISLMTSREDIYTQDTEFLIISPEIERVSLRLLNDKEEELTLLFDEEIVGGEAKVVFPTSSYSAGVYFLSLSSTSTNILRKIKLS